MDFLTGLQLYGIVAAGLAGTSYITLFRPSIELLEEIIEDKSPYSGVFGFCVWNLLSFLAAPVVVFILLQNDNENFIEHLAVALANKIIDE